MRLLVAALGVVTAIAMDARAEPRIDLERCDAFDARALRAAIDRELVLDAATRKRDFTVFVTCPDLVTATLRVEPAPAEGGFGRTIDLGEVPTDLRIKLLALTVAEFVQIVASAPPPAPIPIVKLPPPPPPSPQIIVPGPGPGLVATVPAPPLAFTVEPTVGLRVYANTPMPLAQAGIELGVAGLRIGVRGALGQTTDTLGRMRPWLATLTLAHAIVCSHGSTSICLLARLEGGAAGVTAHVNTNVVAMASDASAAYGQVALAGELGHHFDGWSIVASVEGGWAEGLDARSGGRDAVDLAGLVVIGAIGARWR